MHYGSYELGNDNIWAKIWYEEIVWPGDWSRNFAMKKKTVFGSKTCFPPR
jgi:hypothetical protein